MAFLFRENRRHGTDRQTYRPCSTPNAAPYLDSERMIDGE